MANRIHLAVVQCRHCGVDIEPGGWDHESRVCYPCADPANNGLIPEPAQREADAAMGDPLESEKDLFSDRDRKQLFGGVYLGEPAPESERNKLLKEAHGHLGAAIVQMLDTDDQIICDHVRDAHALLAKAIDWRVK